MRHPRCYMPHIVGEKSVDTEIFDALFRFRETEQSECTGHCCEAFHIGTCPILTRRSSTLAKVNDIAYKRAPCFNFVTSAHKERGLTN